MVSMMGYPMFNFDTLKFAKKLEKAGVEPHLAEIQAEAFGEQAQAINNIIDKQLATKSDLNALQYKITYELTIRIGSMFVAAVVILGILTPIISKFLAHI